MLPVLMQKHTIEARVLITKELSVLVRTPWWFLSGANPPKNRNKRGKRKGKRFGGK